MTERVVPVRARDGFELNLINVRGSQRPEKGPVLLVHGAGVRANIFRARRKFGIAAGFAHTDHPFAYKISASA